MQEVKKNLYLGTVCISGLSLYIYIYKVRKTMAS